MRFPDARIITIEPNPVAFEYLQNNISELNVELHNLALGMSDGQVDVESDADITCCKVKVTPNGTIPMKGLKAFFAEVGAEIDLLKMDCEGFEWELFKDVTAFENVKRIHMEYHLVDNWTLEEFLGLVAKAGFSISQLVENQGFGLAFLER